MPFPEITHCLICDAVRFEERGKLSLLGLLGISPFVNIVVPSIENPIPLSFVMFGGPADGQSYTVEFDILSGDTKHSLAKQGGGAIKIPAGQRLGLISQVALRFPRPGDYGFRVTVDGRKHFDAPFKLVIGKAVSDA